MTERAVPQAFPTRVRGWRCEAKPGVVGVADITIGTMVDEVSQMKRILLLILLIMLLSSCGSPEPRTISLPVLPDGIHTVTIDNLTGDLPVITIEE